jgi:hypothetical protein
MTSFICVAFALLLGPFALLLQAQAEVPAPDGDKTPPHGDRFTNILLGVRGERRATHPDC